MHQRISKFIFPIFLLFMISVPAQAKLFRNSYISFQLPPRWDCALEGTEWVCRSTLKTRHGKHEAIIILTAKIAGPADTIPQYEAHIRTPKSVPDSKGKPTLSKVKHTQKRQISGQIWIDGLQLGSEVPSYYTRYLATAKSKLGILVTFSAHRRYFTKYSADFFRAIQSLKVVATPDMFENKGAVGTLGGPPIIGQADDLEDEEFPEEETGSSNTMEKLFGFGLLISAAGAYIFLKKKRKEQEDNYPYN